MKLSGLNKANAFLSFVVKSDNRMDFHFLILGASVNPSWHNQVQQYALESADTINFTTTINVTTNTHNGNSDNK